MSAESYTNIRVDRYNSLSVSRREITIISLTCDRLKLNTKSYLQASNCLTRLIFLCRYLFQILMIYLFILKRPVKYEY